MRKKNLLIVSFAILSSLALWAQPGSAPNREQQAPPGSGFGGPPGFGPGGFGPGFGPGGFGPGMGRDIELVKKFDQDRNGWLNAEERKLAREFLSKDRATRQQRPGPGRGGRGGFPGMGGVVVPTPGQKLAPTDVESAGNAPLFQSNVIRTVFLNFDSADWEDELEAFHGTDVEVPARLTVDGKTYRDVGVRFRGSSSFMMVGKGSKRSLNVSIDMAHEDQNVLGHRTLNLLNSHEDPTYLRTVLSLAIARHYMAAPKANLVRVAINGEDWGVYVSMEQFNKDFVKERFGTTKGARWKVPGSPGGRGGLEYLGEDAASYQRIYEIKSKDEPKAWNRLIQLCKLLNETPAEKLEAALAPILDIDGALRFLAWDNVLVNGDGFWTRASDYNLYEDEKGQFHIVPYDANETFNTGGGPGGPMMRGFGPGMFIADQVLNQADQNEDNKVSRAEMGSLAEAWCDKMGLKGATEFGLAEFNEKFAAVLPPPEGRGGFGPPGEARRFGPGMAMAPVLFTASDTDKNDKVTRAELKVGLANWFEEWDTTKSGLLDEEALRTGLNKSLPAPNFGGQGPGGRRGPGGPGGPGFAGGPGRGGSTLDPLVSVNDSSKALASRLLAVPALRARYLGYVRDMAEKWLDWNKLGPIATGHHNLIAEHLRADTRKLDSFEAFEAGLGLKVSAQSTQAGPGNERAGSLKSFVEQRRTFLLKHPEVSKAKLPGNATAGQ